MMREFYWVLSIFLIGQMHLKYLYRRCMIQMRMVRERRPVSWGKKHCAENTTRSAEPQSQLQADVKNNNLHLAIVHSTSVAE